MIAVFALPCLFSAYLSLAWQFCNKKLPGVSYVRKIVLGTKTKEAFLFLFVLALLPSMQGWAQTYPVVDSFSGSGALSQNWANTTATGETYVPAAQAGGIAVPSVSGQHSLVTYTGATFISDQFAQVKFVAHSSPGGSTGPCVRMTVEGNGVCYLADLGLIYAVNNGTGSYGILSGCPIPASGDSIQLLVQGQTYTCLDVTTGVSASATDSRYLVGNPGMLLDQRDSTVHALAQFEADCLPSCTALSAPTVISLGSFSTSTANPGFDNAATSYLPSDSMVNNGSTATYDINPGTVWHSALGTSSYISYDPGTGPTGSVVAPNGDYIYTTTFTMGSNLAVDSAVGSLTVLADDTVAVNLNGHLVLNAAGPLGPGDAYYHCSDTGPNCITPLTIMFTGIRSGVNTLAFVVKQVHGASEGLDYVGAIHLNQTTPPLTLAAVSPSPYLVGSAQGFVATLRDGNGNPESGVLVTFNVSGTNNKTGSATTDSSGIASYSYIGSNAGGDVVLATASVGGTQIVSNSVTALWNTPVPATSEGRVTLLAQPQIGLGGLLGAFTDIDGTVIQPLAIGATARNFVVPAGATQLQLGVNDDGFWNNLGTGFAVKANGTSVTVPPTALPWKWIAGGLNAYYQFGYNDGTNPVVALTGLTQGQMVSIAYQSGSVSVGSCCAAFNADGNPRAITGTSIGLGDYYATLYMTSGSYPVGQPVAVSALVTNGSGAPMSNVPVILSVTGANARQFQTATDSTGMAQFIYSGLVPGIDILTAKAIPTGNTTLLSNQTALTWTNFTTLPPLGSLTLTPNATQALPAGGQQTFTVLAADASGTPVTNANVNLIVAGADNFTLTATTDASGHATFIYRNVNPGTASVQAMGSINNVVTFSNVVTVPWTLPPTTTTTSNGSSSTITISITAQNTITLPNGLHLNGTVTDSNLPPGGTLTVAWTQVSGPGTVVFANPQQATTSATFSQAGNYLLQLSANDSVTSGSVQVQVTVNPSSGTTQGWIGSPTYGSTVSGLVPITVATGVTLQSGTLYYYPANALNNVTVLNANTTGSGQIGTFDTTVLANGSYWIELRATDSNGSSQYSEALVTVAGNYKPGRVTVTVTDLIVPATGLAINIQRRYDSINANKSGDFGYGWSLGTTVDLAVNDKGDVTFTLGGIRRTFFLTPQRNSFLGVYAAAFTPEQGFYGTLTDSAPGCQSFFDFLVPDGSLWECIGGGIYNPPGYIYTDPSGTQYTINANGSLQSIIDRGGNALTISATGITSSTGLSVPFVRDASGRITKITDPQGNQYLYSYDSSGNLASVKYPSVSQASTYTYSSNHLHTGGTDARSNPLPTTNYYPDGRLQSVTDASGQTTSYTYDLTTNTTTITYPPDGSGSTGTAQMVYDSYGMLLSSTDPLGHRTTNVYDSNHNLKSVTDPLGHTTSYTYDSNGNRTSTTYPQTTPGTNTTSTTTYNQYSEPTSTTDELGHVRTFTYDANFNPQNVTDPEGVLATFTFNNNGTMQSGAIGYDITTQPIKASQFAYDSHGNLASRTDALNRTTSYTYDSLGRKASMTIPLPNSSTSPAAATTTYQYDALGNLTQTSAPLGRVTSSQYDGNGNKVSDTDALSHVTTYQYDALNRLTTTTYPTSPATTTTRTYDFRNNVIDETDQAGHVTHHVYDLAGRLTLVTAAYGTSNASTTTYTYYDDRRKHTETLGYTTTYTYDAAGRLTAIAGVKGNFQYGYDAAGNRTSSTDGNGHTTQYQYDSRKRLVKTIYPDTTSVTNAYDGPGNLIKVTDQAANAVQYNYDAANQLQGVVQLNHPDTSHNTTAYLYDKDGNLTSLTDANSHTTTDSFDLLNNLTGKTLPDGSSTETRSYDLAGNLLSLQHFNGTTTTYSYDTLNRLLTQTPDASYNEPMVSFTYTSTGRRATMTDASGTTNYTYDSLDRLTAKATPQGTLNYTYDTAGNVASMSSSNANGISVSYTYDSLSRLSTVVDNRLTGANTTTYTYDNASNLATVTYPNGLQSTFNYDTLNRLMSMTAATAGYLYTLGPTGNRTNATELNGRSLTWNYDGIYRLTSETVASDPAGGNGSVGYNLDPVGNRLTATSTLTGISSGTYSYSVNDLLSIESYDSNGNVLTSGGKSFAYDSENRLKSMNGGAVTLQYDGDGNRVAKTVSGVTTRYLVDDLNPTGYAQVVEELVNGAVQREYTYGLQRISQNQIINSTWMPSLYGYDGGGHVRQLTNSAGAVTDTYTYDAFGNKLASTGTTPNNYLYRGEQYDSDLALYYLRARYYNPLSGRFMSRDPEEQCNCSSIHSPASQNKYLYVASDPLNKVDPSGRTAVMEKIQIDWKISLAASAAVSYVGLELVCQFYTDAAAARAVAQPENLGHPQTLKLLRSICSAVSKVPGRDLGPYPAPFYPDENWATDPGNRWKCEANAEGRIISCRKRCPDGGEEWFTWDDGTKYGEPPHWDYHRCDGTTCKIYTDGTSTCTPEGGVPTTG